MCLLRVFLLIVEVYVQLSVAEKCTSFLDVFPEFRQLQNDVKQCQVQLQTVMEGLNEIVAFTAFTTQELKFPRDTFSDVVFDEVALNEGKGYNNQDGCFTAPSDGLYVFTWVFLVDKNHLFDSQIQVNGINKGLSNCNNEEGINQLPCSNTTPLKLKKGDRVNIRKRHGTKAKGDRWCSFKGWKL